MTRFVLSPLAQADVDDIWEYTAEKWSVEQARRYVSNVQFAVESLADNPRRGRPCPDVKAGYYRHAVASHVIFYRVTSTGIEVVRILHQRMDFRRHV